MKFFLIYVYSAFGWWLLWLFAVRSLVATTLRVYACARIKGYSGTMMWHYPSTIFFHYIYLIFYFLTNSTAHMNKWTTREKSVSLLMHATGPIYTHHIYFCTLLSIHCFRCCLHYLQTAFHWPKQINIRIRKDFVSFQCKLFFAFRCMINLRICVQHIITVVQFHSSNDCKIILF